MRYHFFLLLLLSFFILIPIKSHADFDVGQQAYDSGNYKEAFRVWQQSAKEGDAKSQFQLGKMYEEGLGVLQDFVLAHVFYNLAASQGNREAREARNTLTKMMSVDQIGEAQQLAAQWQSSSSSQSPASSQPPPSEPTQTPPQFTVASTPEALFMATDEGDVEKVKRILNSGVGVDARNDKGWTPLMRASFKGNADVVEFLLQNNADVNAQSKDGTTALIAATLPGHTEIVWILVNAKADVNKRNNSGLTASFIAKKKGHSQIINILGPSQEDIEEENRKLRQAEEKQRLEEERRQRLLAEERERQKLEEERKRLAEEKRNQELFAEEHRKNKEKYAIKCGEKVCKSKGGNFGTWNFCGYLAKDWVKFGTKPSEHKIMNNHPSEKNLTRYWGEFRNCLKGKGYP